MDDISSKPGFLERMFGKLVSDAPESMEDLLELLKGAKDHNVFDQDTLFLLERILHFSTLEVRDVMVPRSQINAIRHDDNLESIISTVMETAHSRFPVIGEDKDEVLGILHAKDLLEIFFHHEKFDLKSLLREAVFVPEGKSLIDLTHEFKDKHFHIAMVVDEFGGVCGLVTFEDVIEQIVGEIEDEFDEEDDDDDNSSILEISNGRYRVGAIVEIEEFNEFFGTDFSDEEVDTVGGLIISEVGKLPKKGDKIMVGDLQFTVARADERRLHSLTVQRVDGKKPKRGKSHGFAGSRDSKDSGDSTNPKESKDGGEQSPGESNK